MTDPKCVQYGGELTPPSRLMKSLPKSKKSSSKETPRIEDVLADELKIVTGTRPVREYEFTPLREWRFDIAFPEQKVAIEIAGRYHLRHKRFREDCERNNFARINGWMVFVFPASAVTAKSRRVAIVEQIYRYLCGVNEPDLDCDLLTQPMR
jgi:very-short-patch-repair endonuclease